MDLFNPGQRDVEPVRPIAPYIGGKRQLSTYICALISEIPHSCYVEPFVGMGGVFLRRSRRPEVEVINDVSGEVANLFRILQRHYTAFIDMLRFSVASRSAFVRLNETNPETLTDLERAARFLYLQRLAFGGRVSGRNFGVSVGRSSRFNISTLEPMLADVHDRLSGVIIENLDWETLFETYDRPETLFYMDPPYWDCETDYGKNVFDKSDFGQISKLMGESAAAVIVSLNDTEGVRETFSEHEIIPVELTYSVGKGVTPAKEVLILNRAAVEKRVVA